MINFFRELALSLPETSEEPHFEKTSFRVQKKIFATYDFKTQLACLKLSEKDQDLFSLADSSLIFPVQNKWGKQGWTMARIHELDEDLIRDLVMSAFNQVAPEKLKNSPPPPSPPTT